MNKYILIRTSVPRDRGGWLPGTPLAVQRHKGSQKQGWQSWAVARVRPGRGGPSFLCLRTSRKVASEACGAPGSHI